MRDAIQIVAIDTVANVVCHDTCDARNAGRRLGQMLLLLLMMSITSKKKPRSDHQECILLIHRVTEYLSATQTTEQRAPPD